MNLAEWEKALIENGLMEEYGDVLTDFKLGFDQGIPEHSLQGMRWYTPENHTSADEVKEDILTGISEEIKRGRMFGPFTHEQVAKNFDFFRSNPLGAVVNGDGKIRPINDLSFPRNNKEVPSVNSFVNKHDFDTTWDDYKVVYKFFATNKDAIQLALFDWEKAYRQIPTKMSQWRYLMWKDFNGNLLLDTRITFGGVAGCGSFGRPADIWKLIMKQQFKLIEVFRWVDDNLFVKNSEDNTTMIDVVNKSRVMGVATNEKKFSDFGDEQKFIGFVWNSANRTVRLPPGKIEERIEQLSIFLVEGDKFSYDAVEVLVGRLNHVSYMLEHLKCRLNSLYRWLKSWVHKRALRYIPEDALRDLLIWKDALECFEETRIICWGPPVDVRWVGDASTGFGVGVLIGKRWAQFRLLDRSAKHNIAHLETVAIRLGLLMLLQLQDQSGKNLVVWTDNTTTEATVNNHKSRDTEANAEWAKIQDLLLLHHVNIIAKRVTSKDNKADQLSRGIRSGQEARDQVVVEIPPDLRNLLLQVVFSI
jgi:hypothetical protein